MYRQPFYKIEEFWFGLAIGLTMVAAIAALFFLRAWALRRIRFNLAKRVSGNFVIAGEIFRLLRLPEGSEADLTTEVMTRLIASIDSHTRFFATLLEDKQSFCLFFGPVFTWAFDDVYQIYGDFIRGCDQLKHHLSRRQAGDTSLPVELNRHLKVIISCTDQFNDITYLRLSRAVAVIETVCRPLLEEHAKKHPSESGEPKYPQFAALLTPLT